MDNRHGQKNVCSCKTRVNSENHKYVLVISFPFQAACFEKVQLLMSNTWRPTLCGKSNKCPRLFHPTFGLIHSEYGNGKSETNPIRSHYPLLKIPKLHLVKRDPMVVTNCKATGTI